MARPPCTAADLADLVASIRATPIIDHHAHPLLKPNALARHPLARIATEASGDAIYAAWSSLAHARATKQLAEILGCPPSWEAVVTRIEAARSMTLEYFEAGEGPGGGGSGVATPRSGRGSGTATPSGRGGGRVKGLGGPGDEWTARCFHGLETVLVDDGLDGAADVHDYASLDAFTRTPCKRIVRLERLAEGIIDAQVKDVVANASKGGDDGQQTGRLWDEFVAKYRRAVASAVADPEVAGFKSVVCYRSGLDVPRERDDRAAQAAHADIMSNTPLKDASFRLDHRSLNNYVVHVAAELIRNSVKPSTVEDNVNDDDGAAAPPPSPAQRKPLQFHTGLGDNDLTLTRASPSHLQDFIREYPTVPIVLLHAGYPWTRETGYLATMYANVYADVGEVFPFLSRDGQEGVLRQILELCPWSKILWSTDGHWFPETYLLAVTQIREALERVLTDYVKKGQIGWKAAKRLARDILFTNANNLYNLHIPYDEVYPPSATAFLPTPADGTMTPAALEETPSDLMLLRSFLERNNVAATLLRITWIDLTASPRCRLVPIKRVLQVLQAAANAEGPDEEEVGTGAKRLSVRHPFTIGITKACLGLLQNDHIAPGWTATGEYRLVPDFASLRVGPQPGQISCAGEFREPADGAEVPLCPRTLLRNTVAAAAVQAGLAFRVGFEVEFLLLPREYSDSRRGYLHHPELTDGFDGPRVAHHAWSLARAWHDPAVATLLTNMVSVLAESGIDVEQIHSESAPGQHELVLPHASPLEAVDTLVFARERMATLAAAHGYRMSLHPKPYPDSCGTASHVHLSVVDANDATERTLTDADASRWEPFYAGVLANLRALAAFALPNDASYLRAVDGAWAGGRWVAWGTQNRETPLRKVDGSHWEVKCLDGLANPYLALAAILGAGVLGGGLATADSHGPDAPPPLPRSLRDEWGDCEIDPAAMTANDRFELGVRRMLPATLDEALAALMGEAGSVDEAANTAGEVEVDDEGDEGKVVRRVVGEELAERYVALKKAEAAFLRELSDTEMTELLLERY